jgi:hypothetical protein
MPRLLRLPLLALLLAATVTASPPAPPGPAAWDVQLRYRISAFGSERVKQYRQMLAAFKATGFVRTDDTRDEDEPDLPRATRMKGTVPAGGVARLLGERHVRSLLLVPRGAKLPGKGEYVRVDMELASGYLPETQRALHRQTAGVLARIARFVEGVGYDNRGFTRLLGSVPVEDLPRLPETVLLELKPATPSGELGKMVGFVEVQAPTRRGAPLLAGSVPVDALGLVPVDLALPAPRGEDQQRDVFRRAARGLLKTVGFLETPGYDSKGYTRIVGRVAIDRLGAFLDYARDFLGHPDLPHVVRSSQPIRLVEARPDLPVPVGRPAEPKVPAAQLKFDPALRAFLAGKKATAGAQLEVILGYTPRPTDRSWIGTLESAGAVVEGRLGPLVTVYGVPRTLAPKLAALDSVVAVRLPRVAQRAQVGPRGDVPARWEPVQASGLARLHALGLRGQGTRIAIISDDFKGWQTLRGRKEGKSLLPDPVLVDLTAERSPDLQPDPYPSEELDVALGHGTRCAQTLLRAAPEAELTLVRVDAAAPYMLEIVARAISGERARSVALDARYREVHHDRRSLEERKTNLLEERRTVGANFEEREREEKELFARAEKEDLTPEQVEKLPGFKALPAPAKARLLYDVRQRLFDRDQARLIGREARLLKLVAALQRLKGVRIVASGLVWVDGHPVDGSSALSRYFDDRPFRAALWFQAAGDSRGQAWAGLFHDRDGNGVMEFADPKSRLPAGSWTPELNFLAWQAAGERPAPAIPAGTRLRLTLQWREAHDPLPLRVGDDVYREPLARLRLIVVRQLDPDGKTRPADDLAVVAQTAGPPQRLNQMLNSSTWEQAIELTVPADGRYGVFVEGRLPASTQAPGEAQIPATKKIGEVRPRLFVNTLEGAGRAVWADFTTRTAALGMPADAQSVLTVGAADARNQPRPATPLGTPYNLLLLKKPDVLAYDEGGGTDEAACFAAGFVGSSWSSRGTLFKALEQMGIRPGMVLRVPERRR